MNLFDNKPNAIYSPAVDSDGDVAMIEVSPSAPLYVKLEEYVELDQKATRLQTALNIVNFRNASDSKELVTLYAQINAVRTLARDVVALLQAAHGAAASDFPRYKLADSILTVLKDGETSPANGVEEDDGVWDAVGQTEAATGLKGHPPLDQTFFVNKAGFFQADGHPRQGDVTRAWGLDNSEDDSNG